MAASRDFRENPSRAVYVCGEINEGLVHKLTPEIVALRLNSQEPITVYIDSRGGSIRSTQHLENLLRAPTQDQQSNRIVCVAITQAKSAAALLLAAGDYAIAYPGSEIMHHGTRIPGDAEITTETASSLANWLSSINEDDALNLAELMFRRLVFLHIFFRKSYEEIRAEKPGLVSDVECLAQLIKNGCDPEIASLSMPPSHSSEN